MEYVEVEGSNRRKRGRGKFEGADCSIRKSKSDTEDRLRRHYRFKGLVEPTKKYLAKNRSFKNFYLNF